MNDNGKSGFKLDFKLILAIVITVLLVICLVKIDSLSEENQNMFNAIGNLERRLDLVYSEINSIYANIDEKLREEASLISGVDYSVTGMSVDDAVAKLSISVTPKQISDDMKVSVSVDGITAELARSGSSFEGTLDVGLFIYYDEYPLLSIETADGVMTEYLDDVNISNLFETYLPAIYADMTGTSDYHDGRLGVDLHFTVDVKPSDAPEAVTFTSITLIEVVNGEEIGREDITEDVELADGGYRTSFKDTYIISRGDELRVYVVAEDSLGFIHKNLAFMWFKNGEGAVAEVIFGGESIYDRDGNLLYGSEE